ncbi:hypothetical protein RIF29_21940 [Crotalaria pallida]|uniref:Uncharacterized protein n=1 Tax=Crotalaria pallida TaxID=3830 RepID=A0AAN9F3I1_CROPI
MSAAAVCGIKRRSLFEDDDHLPLSSSSSSCKRLRCSSSPIRTSLPSVIAEDNADDASVSASENAEAVGEEWINLFVSEMTCATSIDDAKARAARLLQILEKSINARATSDSTNALQKENLILKEHIEVLTKEKNCFKSAFKIQHERLSDYESKNQELQQLKQSVSQYQEKIRTLEVNNYALRMHLNQAQQYNPFPGHFPPPGAF